MSALQDLLLALDAVTKGAEYQAAQLAQHARRLGQAASSAANATRASGRADSMQTAAALQSAQRSISQAAQHLHQAALAGRGFVVRHADGGLGLPGGGPEPTPGANPEPRPSWATPRYIAPTAVQQATFAQAVSDLGDHGIGGWIGTTNPNYSTGIEAWTNNCGPCSRAVADAYQGVGVSAAFGDGHQPPGEYVEMWAALGVRPTTRLSNPGRLIEPAKFSAKVYTSLEEQLRQEGPGAVAIVGIDWDDPRVPQGQAGGHWFNAYVDDKGVVRWADGQIGRDDDWPPGYAAPIWNVEAVVRPSGGRPWKEVLL